MKVFVYYNLHRNCWSLKALEGDKKNRVIAHASYVELYDCTPKVSKAGQARVRTEKRKNVHAGVVGTLRVFSRNDEFIQDELDTIDSEDPKPLQVTYNPYKYDTFVWVDSGLEFLGSKFCKLIGKKVYAYE
jgi:hypothetical protein